MSLANVIPSMPAILREALTLLAGAILAALVMNQFPAVKAYVKQALP